MIRIIPLLLMLTLTGCAETTPPPTSKEEPPAFLSVSPASLGHSLSLSQIVTGTYDGREQKMRFELDIGPSRLAVVGLSPLGVTLFTIIQDKNDIKVETAAKGQIPFDPRHMLFDIYLTYWPKAVLRPALARLGMRLDDMEGGKFRRVRGVDGKLIAEIRYPPKRKNTERIVIQHFDHPYRLSIQTLETLGTP